MKQYNLCFLGFGNVGRALARLFAVKSAELRKPYGIEWRITGVATRRIGWLSNANGFKVEIKCSPQYPEFVATTLVMQQALKKIGIDVTVTQMEWGAFVAAHNKEVETGGKEGGDIFASANTFRPDPDGYIYPYFYSKGKLNDGGYDNPKLDPLMAEARTISNHAERRKLYEQIQRALLEDSPNWWWYAKLNIEALSSKVQGYSQSFTGRRIFLKKTWLA